MSDNKDIILSADYHDRNVLCRRFDGPTGREQEVQTSTTARGIRQLVDEAAGEATPGGGQVVWIMESTTGWARVKDLLGAKVRFVMTNVLQMPRSPKAHRRKTDKTDTKRQLREYRNDTLPEAYQPPVWLRRLRRLVAARESLVSRRTAVRNWIDRYLAHETWVSRSGLWSAKGLARLEALRQVLAEPDGIVLGVKLAELAHLETLLGPIQESMEQCYCRWPAAQRVDAIAGIGPISAVSILARMGPLERFPDAEAVISYAGLAPGVRQSDQSRRDGHIGGGGTDRRLRHYLIEATIWARQIPRYQPTYQRVRAKRGNKIARLVVARLLLRSLYKMLRDGVPFEASPAA